MTSKLKKENKSPGKVSVIIPTWNREKTILRAILSVLNQTYTNLEILVCDDGSNDKTKSIVSKIKDKRVVWVEGVHSGLPSVVRNRGINISNGDWVAFLDSDDAWEKNKLEVQLKRMKDVGSFVSCTNGVTLNSNIVLVKNVKEGYISFLDLLDNNKVVCSSVIVSRNILIESGFFNENFGLRATEDYELWLRITTIKNFLFLDDNLVRYNEDSPESIRNLEKSEWKLRVKVFRELDKWLRKRQRSVIGFKYLLYIYFTKRYYYLSLRFSRKLNLLEQVIIKCLSQNV